MKSKNTFPLIISVVYAVVMLYLFLPSPAPQFNYDRCKTSLLENRIALNMNMFEVMRICGKPTLIEKNKQVSSIEKRLFGITEYKDNSPEHFTVYYGSEAHDTEIRLGFNENKELEVTQETEEQKC